MFDYLSGFAYTFSKSDIKLTFILTEACRSLDHLPISFEASLSPNFNHLAYLSPIPTASSLGPEPSRENLVESLVSLTDFVTF